MPTPAPLSGDRLEALLQQRSEMQARPRPTPRQVVATWMENFGVGVGAGVGVGVLLYLLRAPDGVLATGSLSAGLLTFAGMMAWRGSLDERSDWRNARAVRRTVAAMRAECDGQVRILRQQLDAAFDEIETLERSLDQVANERNMAQADLGRERTIAAQGRRSTWTPPEAPAPQDEQDAREMIQHYFAAGNHLSRRRAIEDKRWSAERWKAAQGLLVRAGVLAVNATQPVMLSETLAEALGKFNAYMLRARARQQPPIVAAQQPYVESD